MGGSNQNAKKLKKKVSNYGQQSGVNYESINLQISMIAMMQVNNQF